MIVDAKEMLVRAREGKYGIASPTIWDELSAKMALSVAEKLQSPIILGYFKGYGSEEIVESGRVYELAERAHTAACVMQDHGRTFEENIWGLHAGLPFIMVDRSDLPFEENLAETKEFVRIAHAANVYVEGEVGKTGSISGHYAGIQTDVEEAVRYEKETGVDVIAVTVGNLHGFKLEEPKIDFGAISKLAESLTVPMTTHGSSGIPLPVISRMAKAGITKFNMQTHLSVYSIGELEKYLKEYPVEILKTNHRKRQLKTISEFVYSSWGDELGHYIDALGSRGKSWLDLPKSERAAPSLSGAAEE